MQALPSNHKTTRTRFKAMLAGLGGVAMLLPGCAVGPNYQRPVINAPAQFRHASAAASARSLAELPVDKIRTPLESHKKAIWMSRRRPLVRCSMEALRLLDLPAVLPRDRGEASTVSKNCWRKSEAMTKLTIEQDLDQTDTNPNTNTFRI